MSGTWVRSYEKGSDYVESLGGVIWAEAPLPHWLHRCRVQTRGWIGLAYTERCPCGAMRTSPRSPWVSKNERRRARRRTA